LLVELGTLGETSGLVEVLELKDLATTLSTTGTELW
jgi:hypothetical protein